MVVMVETRRSVVVTRRNFHAGVVVDLECDLVGPEQHSPAVVSVVADVVVVAAVSAAEVRCGVAAVPAVGCVDALTSSVVACEVPAPPPAPRAVS